MLNVVPAIEIRRKLIHIFLGAAIITGIYTHTITVFHLFLLLAFGVFLSFIMVRWNIPLVSKMLDLCERKHSHPGKGAITFVIGCILALKLFPMDIALAAIVVLSIGDGISTIVGIAIGRTKTILSEVKLLEGTIIGIVLASIGAWLFVPLWQAIIASTVAMGLEATELKLNNKILSDNILVPLTAGTAILLLRMYV